MGCGVTAHGGCTWCGGWAMAETWGAVEPVVAGEQDMRGGPRSRIGGTFRSGANPPEAGLAETFLPSMAPMDDDI